MKHFISRYKIMLKALYCLTLCTFLLVSASQAQTLDEVVQTLKQQNTLLKSIEFEYNRKLLMQNLSDNEKFDLYKEWHCTARYQGDQKYILDHKNNSETSLNLYFDGKNTYVDWEKNYGNSTYVDWVKSELYSVFSSDDSEVINGRDSRWGARPTPRWYMDEIYNCGTINENIENAEHIYIENQDDFTVLTLVRFKGNMILTLYFDPNFDFRMTKFQFKTAGSMSFAEIEQFKEVKVENGTIHIPIKIAQMNYDTNGSFKSREEMTVNDFTLNEEYSNNSFKVEKSKSVFTIFSKDTN